MYTKSHEHVCLHLECNSLNIYFCSKKNSGTKVIEKSEKAHFCVEYIFFSMKCCVMEVVKKRQPTRHIFHLFLTESSEQPGSIGPALVTLARAFG
jgi:hypothetical protein